MVEVIFKNWTYIYLLYSLAIALLGIFPRELKLYVSHKNLYTSVFIATLLVTAPKQKQPKCPSIVNG